MNMLLMELINNETQTNIKSSPTAIKIQIIQDRDIFFKPTEWTNYQSKTNDAKTFQPLIKSSSVM